jgi:hypothetical protein
MALSGLWCQSTIPCVFSQKNEWESKGVVTFACDSTLTQPLQPKETCMAKCLYILCQLYLSFYLKVETEPASETFYILFPNNEQWPDKSLW